MLVVETVEDPARARGRQGDQGDRAGSAAVAQGGAQGDPAPEGAFDYRRRFSRCPGSDRFRSGSTRCLRRTRRGIGVIGCG